MKIIDPKTGKRLIDTDKKVQKEIKKTDPIKRNIEKGLEGEEHSPMDPPDAYEGKAGANSDQMDELLQQFIEEHKRTIELVDQFEQALQQFREDNFMLNKEINEAFGSFFHYFDHHFLDHNQKEEKQLFPLLHKRLIESGEHGGGTNPRTAVDMMEDDHIKFIQLAALAFNMLGLAPRLKDRDAAMFVYNVAHDNSRELVEMIRLHIYREENILFPLANRLITREEFNAIRQEQLSMQNHEQ